ncbi:hypothetical protein H7J88_21100 [Mycolicibacterium flavescens]|nr:hypothetical protein [Mycolicibacterium flavescens]
MTTFRLGLPSWPVFTYLRGGEPLVRRTDQIEAVVLLLAVFVSVVAVPVALAVSTAVYDGSGAVFGAVLAGGALWAFVAGAAASLYLVTRAMCNHVRSANWQHTLERLVDHGEGQPSA